MNELKLPNFQHHDNLFYGLDLAKKTSQLAILAPSGEELANFPFSSSKENFLCLARVLRPTDSIALEVSPPANAVMRPTSMVFQMERSASGLSMPFTSAIGRYRVASP